MGTLMVKTLDFSPLKSKGTIRIYLPDSYHTSNKSYSVIYMHDGQNLFEVETSSYGGCWYVQDELAKIKDQKEFIVVGIDHGPDRYAEYSPWEYENTYQEVTDYKNYQGKTGGDGDLYGEFIVNRLKPYIDENYRTLQSKEDTLIMGSSMGGLISLYLGFKYPDTFGKVAAVSTAVWFAKPSLMKWCENQGDYQSIYTDIGTNETSGEEVENYPYIYLNDVKDLAQHLEKHISSMSRAKFEIFEGAIHHESSWQARYLDMIKWLFELN